MTAMLDAPEEEGREGPQAGVKEEVGYSDSMH